MSILVYGSDFVHAQYSFDINEDFPVEITHLSLLRTWRSLLWSSDQY